MSFFVSNSLKGKIDINVINDQMEEKKPSDFSLTLSIGNINYEIAEINHDETLKINIMLTKEIVENFLNLNLENKEMKVYVYDQCLYSFYSKDAIIEFAYLKGNTTGYYAAGIGILTAVLTSIYSFVKSEIIITNYKNELQGDTNVESNN